MRLPMCLMVDDPMPLLNPLYYVEQQVRKNDPPRQESGGPVAPMIPMELAMTHKRYLPQ